MQKANERCIFCKIINKSIPNAIVYEDDKFLVFLDKYPINHGHTLVIPKDHFDNILEMPTNLVGEIHSLVPLIARAVISTIGGNGFNVSQNNGKSANQIIPHVHIHIVPRFPAEKIKGQWPTRKIANIEELTILAEKIKTNLKT
jgi:histidine triad (HIT) family protein